MPVSRTLLSIIELGGYPSFTPLYENAGYVVTSVVSVRKALGVIKQSCPDVIVAEFNFQSDFRDRTSSLESLLAVVQRYPQTRVIVFYEPGAPALDIRDGTSQSPSRTRARRVDLLRRPGTPRGPRPRWLPAPPGAAR